MADLACVRCAYEAGAVGGGAPPPGRGAAGRALQGQGPHDHHGDARRSAASTGPRSKGAQQDPDARRSLDSPGRRSKRARQDPRDIRATPGRWRSREPVGDVKAVELVRDFMGGGGGGCTSSRAIG